VAIGGLRNDADLIVQKLPSLQAHAQLASQLGQEGIAQVPVCLGVGVQDELLNSQVGCGLADQKAQDIRVVRPLRHGWEPLSRRKENLAQQCLAGFQPQPLGLHFSRGHGLAVKRLSCTPGLVQDLFSSRFGLRLGCLADACRPCPGIFDGLTRFGLRFTQYPTRQLSKALVARTRGDN